MKYIIISHPTQAEEGTPVYIMTAKNLNSIPTDVQPYDPDDLNQVANASELMKRMTEDPDPIADVLGRIIMSYGGARKIVGNDHSIGASMPLF